MNFRDIKIRNKLALILAGFAFFIVAVMYTLYYYQVKEELANRMFFHLSSVKELKQFQITQKLTELKKAFYSGHLSSYLSDHNEIIFKGEIYADTVIRGFPVSLKSAMDRQVYMKDLTMYDKNGIITLGLMKNTNGKRELMIIQPDIQSVLLERTGLGFSGESYLVGEHNRMLSQSRFFPDKKPTEIVVESKGVMYGLNGLSGNGVFEDYRKVRVFSVYSQIAISGIKWVILTEMDEKEALQPLRHLNRNLLFILLFISILIFVFSYQLSARLTKPLLQVSMYLQEMSRGIYKPNMMLEYRNDEIGELYTSLKSLVTAIEQAIVFADEIGNGNFKEKFQPLSEKDKLGISLVQMKNRLLEYRNKEKELEQKNRESFITGEENERKRLSKDIHDGIGPLLTLLQLKIEKLTLSDTDKKELLRLITDVLDELRRVSYNLMPSVLIDFGAGEAIRNLLSTIRSENITVDYVYDNNDKITVPVEISILLFRLVQEAVNNVIKHAGATHLKVSLTEFSDKVSLYIKDNGKGFDPDDVGMGNGLRNMRERVYLKNGTFELSTSANGTIIEVEVPLT